MREDRFIGQDIVVDKYAAPLASYQMTTRDYVVRPSANGVSGPIVMTLPSVSEARGRFYSILIREADPTNTVTIQDRDDSEAWGGDYILVGAGPELLFYSDGMSWQAIFGAIGVISTKTDILSAAVKTLRATPVTLVPALGADRLIEFVSATLVLNYGGNNGFTENADNLAVKYTDGAGVAVSDTVETTGFIDQVADTITRGVPVNDAIVASAASINKALVLHNTGAAEIAGNAAGDNVLTVFTLFRIINTA
jgi:hypothetical protein